ncbi:hypothetical protein [Oleomonas cavernae]|uniref:hypothetical protein n=1 Tax=Oleomonas cavernae TaxID=2320859 RepID=UPI0011C3E4DF|nr:hypothetical protein [Oleomonas cavernae]
MFTVKKVSMGWRHENWSDQLDVRSLRPHLTLATTAFIGDGPIVHWAFHNNPTYADPVEDQRETTITCLTSQGTINPKPKKKLRPVTRSDEDRPSKGSLK